MVLNVLLNLNVSHKPLNDNKLNVKLKIKFLFVEQILLVILQFAYWPIVLRYTGSHTYKNSKLRKASPTHFKN